MWSVAPISIIKHQAMIAGTAAFDWMTDSISKQCPKIYSVNIHIVELVKFWLADTGIFMKNWKSKHETWKNAIQRFYSILFYSTHCHLSVICHTDGLYTITPTWTTSDNDCRTSRFWLDESYDSWTLSYRLLTAIHTAIHRRKSALRVIL